MAFRLVSAETKRCDRIEQVIQEAEEINHHGSIGEGEREDKAYREANIRQAIMEGVTRPFEWFTGEVKSTGLIRRVNGQHSTHVFLNFSEDERKTVPMPVYLLLGKYECDTEDDLAFLFSQFDQPWISRSREDYIGAYLANRPELASKTNRTASTYATAGLLWYLQKAEGFSGKSARDQYELVLKNADIQAFLVFCGYDGLNLNKRMPEMTQKAVVAAMYHTTRGGIEEDKNFWRRVSGGRSAIIDAESPEYKLAYFLEQTKERAPHWSTPVKNRFRNKLNPNDVEIFATCLRVFTAQRRGVPLGDPFVQVREQNVMEIIKRMPLSQAA